MVSVTPHAAECPCHARKRDRGRLGRKRRHVADMGGHGSARTNSSPAGPAIMTGAAGWIGRCGAEGVGQPLCRAAVTLAKIEADPAGARGQGFWDMAAAMGTDVRGWR
ncbi:hypothetical protein GCM10018952_04940 [Streptosporangium vulgare]